MLIANCTTKSSNGMAGAAKPVGQWLELRSITYNGAAKPVRMLRTISLPSVPLATEGFTCDPNGLMALVTLENKTAIKSFRKGGERGLSRRSHNPRKGLVRVGPEATVNKLTVDLRRVGRAVGDDVLQAQAVDTVALMLARTNRRKPAWAGTEKGR